MPLNHDQIGVVIPIYKTTPTPEEDKSISRAFHILNKYRFYFVAPQDLDLTNYEKYFAYSPKIIKFSNSYFNKGLEGYNQLMLSKVFYNEFSSCKYILIYHPDSYVFRDDLMEWCMKGYDYIGAPWVESESGKINLNGVGNGGFSLRKVESFLYVLGLCETKTTCEMSHIKRKIYKILNKTIRWRIKLLRLTGNGKATFYKERNFNEDGFWGLSAPTITKKFKTASEKTALKFAFDTYPDALYLINDYQLPFGCHAWARINPIFWKQHILRDDMYGEAINSMTSPQPLVEKALAGSRKHWLMENLPFFQKDKSYVNDLTMGKEILEVPEITRDAISIGITTFENRFMQYFVPLLNKIRECDGEVEIVVAINGEHNIDFGEDYRKNILEYLASKNKVYPIMFPRFRGLSKLWNSIIIHATTDYILILNDDIMITNKFMDDVINAVRRNKGKTFTINKSWSHFLINREEIDQLGYFDERLLGIGEEDGDIVWRYINHYGSSVGNYKIKSFTNYAEDTVHNYKPQNIKCHSNSKYSLFNRNFINTKYRESSSGIKGMGATPVEIMDPGQKQYPNEKFYLLHKGEL